MVGPHFSLDDFAEVCTTSLSSNDKLVGRRQRSKTTEYRVARLPIAAKLVANDGLNSCKLIAQPMGKLRYEAFAKAFFGRQPLRRALHVLSGSRKLLHLKSGEDKVFVLGKSSGCF